MKVFVPPSEPGTSMRVMTPSRAVGLGTHRNCRRAASEDGRDSTRDRDSRSGLAVGTRGIDNRHCAAQFLSKPPCTGRPYPPMTGVLRRRTGVARAASHARIRGNTSSGARSDRSRPPCP